MSKNTVALSATGQAIPAGRGIVDRVVVTASSSGVIRLVDSPNSSSGRVILSDLTVTAGNNIELGFEYYEGVHLVLVSGTATIQIGYTNN